MDYLFKVRIVKLASTASIDVSISSGFNSSESFSLSDDKLLTSMPSKTLSLYIYVKVDIDATARCWFNIDRYFTLSNSVYLHW